MIDFTNIWHDNNLNQEYWWGVASPSGIDKLFVL